MLRSKRIVDLTWIRPLWIFALRPALGDGAAFAEGDVIAESGKLVSLIVAHCNTEVFQAFLNTMTEEIPAEEGKQIHLGLDNAGWHKSATLDWHHIKPVYLSP